MIGKLLSNRNDGKYTICVWLGMLASNLLVRKEMKTHGVMDLAYRIRSEERGNFQEWISVWETLVLWAVTLGP